MPDDATFPARILDGVGPLWFRRLPLVLGLALLLVAPFMTAASSDAGAFVFCAAIASAIMPTFPPRFRARAARLRCGPGAVEVGSAGLVSQTLRARDLIGATTAEVAGKISLALAHRKRPLSPVVLELSSRAELDAVCRSLGIGHHGFGSVGWGLRGGYAAGLEVAARAVTSLALVFFAAGMAWGGDAAQGVAALAAFVALGAGMLAGGAWMTRTGPAPRVYMDHTGLHYGSSLRMRHVPFAEIGRLELVGGDVHVVTDVGTRGQQHDWMRAPTTRVARDGVSPEERALALAQIDAAVARAHGRFVLKDEAPSVVEVLRRREGEGARAWLARLEALSATVGVSGYRGGALELADLERVLGDPEAPADLRAGAARVLSRVAAPGEVRVRIAEALEATREPAVRRRIEAAIDRDLARAEMTLDQDVTPPPAVRRAVR